MTDREDAPGDREGRRDDEAARGRGLERLGDLLPGAARRLGLEDELMLASAMAAWERVVGRRAAAAAGACRLVSLDRGVAVVEADEPIVGQELRLRSRELLAALRGAVDFPVRELRVVVRHV